MSITRRAFICATAATPFLAPALRAAPAPQLSTAIDRIVSETLSDQPETATGLGLDTGIHAAARHQLADRSQIARHWVPLQAQQSLKSLEAVDRSALTFEQELLRQSVRQQLDNAVAGRRFDFGNAGRFGGGSPYVVSQQDGSYQFIPTFLDTIHPVKSGDDGEAYLDRLQQFARALDQETARVRRDSARRIIPPTYIIDKAIGQLEGALAVEPAKSNLVNSLARRAQAAGVAGRWAESSEQIVKRQVYPALQRQLAQMRQARSSAGLDAGIWRLADGAAYYAWLLQYHTTTDLSADEIHRLGVEQGSELDAALDAAFRSIGRANGSTGERLAALNADPAQGFADDDQGRRELLAYVDSKLNALRALMPRVSALNIDVPIRVSRVPPDIEAGAPLGYLIPGSLDGSRSSIYYINLKDTHYWPKYALATLSAHEGIPGHAWQAAYAIHSAAKTPAILNLLTFNAYNEGWGLYAEQLADELGLYASDPTAKIGMLQALRFRAARLVVDTGIHSQRWSRDKAVAYLVEKTGKPRDFCLSEVDRYCSAPGQACSYKVGHTQILALRQSCKERLGNRFDIRSFNDAVIQAGPMPLSLLKTVMEKYCGGTS